MSLVGKRLSLPTQSEQPVNQVITDVMAAELNLTFFARRAGETSSTYQTALSDFAQMWEKLKSLRDPSEFI